MSKFDEILKGIEHSLDGEYEWFHFIPTLLGTGFLCTIDFGFNSGFLEPSTQLILEAVFFLLGAFWSVLLMLRSSFCDEPIQEFVNVVYATAGFIFPVGMGVSWGSALMKAL